MRSVAYPLWTAACYEQAMAMAASAVQPGETSVLSQIGPQTMNVAQGPNAQSGSSFQNRLNEALGKGSQGQADLPADMKNQKPRKPGDSAAPKAAASNLQTPAIVAAPADSKTASTKDGSSSSSPSSSSSQPTSGNQVQAPGGSKRVVADSQFSWLMQMLPDALETQSLPTGAGEPDAASGKASGDARSTPQAANGTGKTPVSGDSSDAAEALVKGTLAGKGKLEGAAAESSATATLVSSGSGASSAQGQDPSQQGNAVPASPASHSSGEDVRLSNAVASMESLGLKLFSASTPQSGATNGAAAPDGHGAAASSASGAVHVHAQSANVSQNARDASLLNSGGPQSGQARSDASSAPIAAGTSGDPSKNGASPDTAGKRSGDSGAAANANPSSTPGAASASSTSAAAQVAANGFAIPSNQTAASANLPAHALAQAAPSQATPADRMAAAENPLNPAGGIVNAASMLQAQGRTEMHVALNTESLGPLQLHAVLDGNRVGASIAVVNHEAHTLLTNELPALQQVLSDQNLRVEHLSVLSSPMHSGTGTGQGQNFHSGDFHQPRDNAPRWTAAPSVPLPASGGKEALTEIRRRLSVRA